MGLDTVELVMEVEMTFGIAIPDQEAGGIQTVGALCRCILAKITIDDRALCLSSVAFDRVRRAVIDAFGVRRADVRPATPLAALIPRVDRVEILAQQERVRIVPEPRTWNEAEVWETLRGLIVEQLGVTPDEVTEHAGWAELGAD